MITIPGTSDHHHLECVITISGTTDRHPCITHLNAERLTGEHGFAVHADATAGGHEDVAIMEAIAEVRRAGRYPRRCDMDVSYPRLHEVVRD
jgi:hypothetical protein